jgi:polysaccharide export outer membrane protein
LWDWRGFAVMCRTIVYLIFKKYRIVKNLILSFVFIVLFTGCNTQKQVVYLQNAGTMINHSDSNKSSIPDPKLKIGDLLIITVNASTPEAAVPFNLPLIPSGESMNSYAMSSGVGISGGAGLQNYLVDVNGYITFPILGKINVMGMNKTDLSEYIKDKIYPFYIKEEPIISIRYANYKVSVLGEVARPSVYYIQNERINILEAIALAGDLTIYGKRNNLLLIRENNEGMRESVRIDLRDERLIDSPYYYLQQNDVIYIQPNNPKSRSSALSTAESLSISIVGTLISLTSLLVNLLR